MKKWFFSAVLILLFSAQGSLAREVAGVRVPETVRLESSDTELVLNGAGVRKKSFVKVYVGALYLPRRLNDVDAILNEPGAKSITMKFLYSKVSGDRIIDNLMKALTKNSHDEELSFFQKILKKFRGLFRDVHRGDTIRMDYLPAEGTKVWLNNTLLCTIRGGDFYRALLNVWLGPGSSDKDLKEAMLGASV